MYATLGAIGGLAVSLILCSNATAAAEPAAATPAARTIHIKNFLFAPATATIHSGDAVTFVNDDDEAHTVTAKDKSFDSAGMDAGSRWQHTFRQTGSFTYFCELHPYMTATLVVLPAAGGTRPGTP